MDETALEMYDVKAYYLHVFRGNVTAKLIVKIFTNWIWV